ncbi:MAG: cytochrome c family protein [Planctomycetota bacterium]
MTTNEETELEELMHTFLKGRFWICLFLFGLLGCGDVEEIRKDSNSQQKNIQEFSENQNTNSSSEAVVYFSGNLQGYLEPCGCTRGQFGGMKRRANFITSLQTPGIYVENGDMTSMRERLDEMKQELILKCFQSLEYQVVNLGEKDLFLGIERLLKSPVPLLSGNFRSSGKIVFPATHEIKTKTFSLTIIGLLSDSFRAELLKVNPNYDLIPPKEALIEIMKTIPEDHRVLLMLHGSRFEGGPILANFPRIEAAICAHEYNMPQEASLLFPSGMYGKELGSLHFKKEEPLQYKLIALNNSEQANPKIQPFINDFYQKLTQEKNLIRPITNEYSTAHYVGSDTCLACHQNEYETWKHSLHFKAIPTLKEKQQDQNPECLRCHTVGYGLPSGFLKVDAPNAMTEKLGAVGCESCHGSGEIHLQNPLISMKATAKSCLKCHTPENSPTFDFVQYWPKIKH